MSVYLYSELKCDVKNTYILLGFQCIRAREKKVQVMDYDGIQFRVVNTEPKLAIFLEGKYDSSRSFGSFKLYSIPLKNSINLRRCKLSFFELCPVQSTMSGSTFVAVEVKVMFGHTNEPFTSALNALKFCDKSPKRCTILSELYR